MRYDLEELNKFMDSDELFMFVTGEKLTSKTEAIINYLSKRDSTQEVPILENFYEDVFDNIEDYIDTEDYNWVILKTQAEIDIDAIENSKGNLTKIFVITDNQQIIPEGYRYTKVYNLLGIDLMRDRNLTINEMINIEPYLLDKVHSKFRFDRLMEDEYGNVLDTLKVSKLIELTVLDKRVVIDLIKRGLVKEYYDIADNKVKYVLTYQFMLYYLYTKTEKDVLYKNFVISEIQQYGDFYYSVDGTDITVFNGIGSKRTKFETILLDLQCIKEGINC